MATKTKTPAKAPAAAPDDDVKLPKDFDRVNPADEFLEMLTSKWGGGNDGRDEIETVLEPLFEEYNKIDWQLKKVQPLIDRRDAIRGKLKEIYRGVIRATRQLVAAEPFDDQLLAKLQAAGGWKQMQENGAADQQIKDNLLKRSKDASRHYMAKGTGLYHRGASVAFYLDAGYGDDPILEDAELVKHARRLLKIPPAPPAPPKPAKTPDPKPAPAAKKPATKKKPAAKKPVAKKPVPDFFDDEENDVDDTFEKGKAAAIAGPPKTKVASEDTPGFAAKPKQSWGKWSKRFEKAVGLKVADLNEAHFRRVEAMHQAGKTPSAAAAEFATTSPPPGAVAKAAPEKPSIAHPDAQAEDDIDQLAIADALHPQRPQPFFTREQLLKAYTYDTLADDRVKDVLFDERGHGWIVTGHAAPENAPERFALAAVTDAEVFAGPTVTYDQAKRRARPGQPPSLEHRLVTGPKGKRWVILSKAFGRDLTFTAAAAREPMFADA